MSDKVGMVLTGVQGIRARNDAVGGPMVELVGEFDCGNLDGLRDALEAAAATGHPSGLPISVDLSGVSFLDLGAARELAVCSQLYAGRVLLRHPSPQVLSSVAAFGLRDWFRFGETAPMGG